MSIDDYQWGRADDSAVDVSVVQLIANPKPFDGKKVRLKGFLRLKFEGHAIYLHREDYVWGIRSNAFWFGIPDDLQIEEWSEIDMTYVLCEGVFRTDDRGHMGAFSGAITDVTLLQRCWRIPEEFLQQ